MGCAFDDFILDCSFGCNFLFWFVVLIIRRSDVVLLFVSSATSVRPPPRSFDTYKPAIDNPTLPIAPSTSSSASPPSDSAKNFSTYPSLRSSYAPFLPVLLPLADGSPKYPFSGTLPAESLFLYHSLPPCFCRYFAVSPGFP